MDACVELIVPLQVGIVNDSKNLSLVVCPIFVGQLAGRLAQLFRKVTASRTVLPLQHGLYRPHILLQLPQPGGAGVFPGAGIGNVKHIAQPGFMTGIVHQSDALGTTAHIPAHFLVPQVVLSAGGSIRALGIDHQLFVERIFVKPGGSGEKARPFPPVSGEFCCCIIGHLPVKFRFAWHGCLSPSFQFLDL